MAEPISLHAGALERELRRRLSEARSLYVMQRVPRRLFMVPELAASAYQDSPGRWASSGLALHISTFTQR